MLKVTQLESSSLPTFSLSLGSRLCRQAKQSLLDAVLISDTGLCAVVRVKGSRDQSRDMNSVLIEATLNPGLSAH